MEEDDEMQSPGSDSPSPQPPPPPPQQPPEITVTVAAAPPPSTTPTSTPPPPSSSQHALTLAFPIQQSSRIPTTIAITTGGGREDCWSEVATSVLIDAWGERYMELSRGNLKQKHWKEVADIVNSHEDYMKTPKTDIQCKNRIDTVKKKFKIEKAKVSAGNGPSRWPFFERLDRLIGSSTSVTPNPNKGVGFGAAVSSTGGPASSEKAVPVGIPVGVRQQQPLPLPFSPHYLQTRPHLQSPQQVLQQLRYNNNTNFASPSNSMPQLRYTNTTFTNNFSGGNVNNITGLRQAQAQVKQLAAQQQQLRRNPPIVDSDSDPDPDEGSNDSRGSLPPKMRGEFDNGKRARVMGVGPPKRGEEGVNVKGEKKNKKGKEKKGGAMKQWGSSVRDLTMAILKFGEAYEAVESKKLQHVKEMEMQRMKFAKELELQRMKFMMKTQLKLSQLNGNGNSDSRGDGSGGGGESNHHHNHNHHHHIHENHINQANSDSSN